MFETAINFQCPFCGKNEKYLECYDCGGLTGFIIGKDENGRIGIVHKHCFAMMTGFICDSCGKKVSMNDALSYMQKITAKKVWLNKPKLSNKSATNEIDSIITGGLQVILEGITIIAKIFCAIITLSFFKKK